MDQKSSTPSTAKEKLGLFVLWLPYAFLVNRFWFVSDDAFISFRYAVNWANGHGPRYNLGEHVPVEGYSNFLWVALNALLELMGADLTFWPLLFSFACGSVLIGRVFFTLRRQLEMSLPVSFTATLLLSCSPPFAAWSTGGLETTPYALLMFLTFEALFLRRQGPEPTAAGFFGLAMALIRVEGIYWAILLAALAAASLLLRSKRDFRPILLYLGTVLTGYAIYWSWRYAYYQDLFSNTVYVKTEISAAFLERGLDYVLVQHLTFLPLLLNLPALVYALRRNRLAVGLPTAAMASGMVGYSILVGGDFMTMGRFLIPGLAFNAVLFGWMLSDLGRRPGPRRQVTTAAALAVITAGILPAWDIHPVPESFREKFHFRLNFTEYHSEYEMWEFQKLNEKMRGITGRALKAYAEPADSVVLGAIGAIGYYSEAFVIDRCGLVTRKIGNMARPGTTGSPGHDRCVPWKSLIQEEPDIPSFTLLPGSDIPGYVDRRIIDDWSPGTETRLSSRYAPDFVPVRDEENHTPDQYLFVIRKIREGQNPDAVWKEVHERARQLEGTGPGED